MTAPHAGSGLCRNCGTPAPGNFCPYCGQSTAQHTLSVVEFFHEIVAHYVAVEGKLWRTLALLALQPGRLTREYLAGRREHYVIPLRLYLTASFLFFALSQWIAQPVDIVVLRPGAPGHAGGPTAAPDAAAGGAPVEAEAPRAQPPAGGAAVRKQLQVIEFDADDRDSLDRTLASAQGTLCADPAAADCPWWKRLPSRAIVNLKRDPAHVAERFAERFRHSLSYAMFLLLPVFAGWLALAYAGRRMYYGEHLVFALHVHSFWFLVALLFLVLPDALEPLLPVAFVGYGLWALRRVYGGRWGPTLLRGLAVAVLYGVTIGIGAGLLSIALLAT